VQDVEEPRRKRRRLSEDEWRGLLQRFSEGGETVRAFCQREGLSAESFRRWRARLSGRAEAASTQPTMDDTTTNFVDLGALAAAPMLATGRLELKLDLGGGLTLHIIRG
jgi:putative transposase